MSRWRVDGWRDVDGERSRYGLIVYRSGCTVLAGRKCWRLHWYPVAAASPTPEDGKPE